MPLVHDLLEKLGHVLVVERREATQHDVEDHAHGPYVAARAVADILQHLWRDIFGRATRRFHEFFAVGSSF